MQCVTAAAAAANGSADSRTPQLRTCKKIPPPALKSMEVSHRGSSWRPGLESKGVALLSTPMSLCFRKNSHAGRARDGHVRRAPSAAVMGGS